MNFFPSNYICSYFLCNPDVITTGSLVLTCKSCCWS